jgi:phosphatidylserine/phosphatidylglycerophosphate/cardiolipin synthase-like enzyme
MAKTIAAKRVARRGGKRAAQKASAPSVQQASDARVRAARQASDANLHALAAEIRATDEPAPRRSRASRGAASASAFDIVAPSRPVAMELIGGRGHYERVLAAVMNARVSVWIATANVKELMVEDHRARPGRRRSMKKAAYVSVLSQLDALAERGVELRLLHAEIPSRPFREEIANHPRLLEGGLALRRCPRVHMKAVIVDGELLYLGSANWTGAGLGAKGSGRRNFELGFVTDDALLLDQVQALFEHLWNGGECGSCRLQDECPGPLSQLRTS